VNICLVAQGGRIGYQAALCAASIRAFHNAADVSIFICVPKNSNNWKNDPGISDTDLVAAFRHYDCTVIAFENRDFGSTYPHSNKFYSMMSLPSDEPFLFLDSDTVLVKRIGAGDMNLSAPKLNPGGPSWPKIGPTTGTIGDIWHGLYRYFDLDDSGYVDTSRGSNDRDRYPYYNAGVIYYEKAGLFGKTFLDVALRIWHEKPAAIEGQQLRPWLDQISLPLVLATLGAPRFGKVDPIHDNIVHYHFPFYLQVRHRRAAEIFDELRKDALLTSVLQKDEAFRYYMSDEGRAIVREVHREVGGSDVPDRYKKFLQMLRARVPILR
jgi:hypothetical protein